MEIKSKTTIVVTPLDFEMRDGQTVARDESLYAAIMAYCREEFGTEPNMAAFTRSFAVLEMEGNTLVQVLGVSGLQTIVDCPMFHVGRKLNIKVKSREQQVLEARATKALFLRGRQYLADIGCAGKSVLIFVSPSMCAQWKSFLESNGAVDANRFQLTI